MHCKIRGFLGRLFGGLCLLLPLSVMADDGLKRPNVILILTDDQGYGEIAAHGNPIIKTPNMDRLHAESVRLTQFHVDPTCSPTRSALMTGRYSTRTGVWHTINGRSSMNSRELTMAEVFKANGYATAMFGKWHLGENFPCRPADQGFDHSIWHRDGCIGGGPDYWDNDYFDDTYTADGEWKKFEGYCTDVWFREATRWIGEHREQPFFLYLPTNAPHGPYIVEDRYSKPYEDAGMPKTMAKFYGMIANIDENFGRLRKQLEDWGMAENTLLIYTTDNGTTAGWIDMDARYPYFNAGMRGWKESEYEGGHRVPCFWHWPAGGLTGGRDVNALTAHFDILPTLVDLLKLKKPDGPALDGIPLTGPLRGVAEEFPSRSLFVHVQRQFLPPKWKRSVVMNGDWRLVNGKELYDLGQDPGQRSNIAGKHPEVVKRLTADYEAWWTSLQPDLQQTVRYVLGGGENPMTLSSHDWLMPPGKDAAWHQNQIRKGSLLNGPWAVEVAQAGTYEISLHRWAPYLGKAMDMKSARLKIGDFDASMDLSADAVEAKFKVGLNPGPMMLQTWLIRPDATESGAYYVTVKRLDVSP